MTEIGYDYDSLRREVAVYLGFSPDPAAWTSQESQNIDDTMAYGLQLFYAPSLDRKAIAHRWTFLRPLGMLLTKANQAEYLLSEDFAGLDGSPCWQKDSGSLTTVVKVINESYWRQFRDSPTMVSSIGPCYAAIWPTRVEGQTVQRYVMGLLPTPTEEIRIEFRYYATQKRLSPTNPIALGMPVHADALRAAMMAAAELRMDDTKGPQWDTYQERIQVAIALDRRNLQSDALPMVVDQASAARRYVVGDSVSINVTTVAGGGTTPPSSGSSFSGGFSGGFA
jgi:hypothetical protein